MGESRESERDGKGEVKEDGEGGVGMRGEIKKMAYLSEDLPCLGLRVMPVSYQISEQISAFDQLQHQISP